MIDERNKKILAAYDQGLSLTQIACKIKVSRGTVAGVLHRSGKANRGGKREKRKTPETWRYGKWTVLDHRAGTNRSGNSVWLCRCDCGAVKTVTARNLQRGASRQCQSCANHSRSLKASARVSA